jgi:hypothetical protein
VATLHAAFIASPKHFENLIDPAFTHLGIGIVHVGGTLYVSEMFMKLNAPPAPVVAPVSTPVTAAPAPLPKPAPAPKPVVAKPAPAPVAVAAAPAPPAPVESIAPPVEPVAPPVEAAPPAPAPAPTPLLVSVLLSLRTFDA